MDGITDEAYKLLLAAYNGRDEAARKRAEEEDRRREQEKEAVAEMAFVLDELQKDVDEVAAALHKDGLLGLIQVEDGKNIYTSIAEAVLKAIDELPGGHPMKEKRESVNFGRISFACFYDRDEDATEELVKLLKKSNSTAAKTKAEAAEKAGAIMTIGNRLLTISDKEYMDAFTTRISGNIGLFRGEVVQGKVVKRELALDIPATFVQGLAKVVLIHYANGLQDRLGVKIYFPALLQELGLNVTQKTEAETGVSRSDSRQAYYYKTMQDLENIWGLLPNSTTEYKLISVHAYNPVTEEVTFVSPYIGKLFSDLLQKEQKQISDGAKYFNWTCDLLHASAANERNQAAVEMATRILVGVTQRGTTPDKKMPKYKNSDIEDNRLVTWNISCAGLIADCPKIRERIKNQTTSTKTQTLKRTFTAMYKVLRTKTDLFKYYNDVQIVEVIPTAKTLNTYVSISHRGINSKYKKPMLPIIEAPADDPQPDNEE